MWNVLRKQRQPKSSPGRAPRRTAPRIEPLEDRRLMIVGAFSVAPATGVGTWLDGVVRIQGDFGNCTGTSLMSGRHVLTAAHCLQQSGAIQNEARVTFEAQGVAPLTMTVPKSNFRIHEAYDPATGANDIAILVLPATIPTSVPRYDLYTAGDEGGKNFVMAGYGRTGTGTTGATGASGTRRFGGNRVDSVTAAYLNFDFDNPNQNTTSIGTTESNLAPGDSGGPVFIGNRIAGVILRGQDTNNFGFGSTSAAGRIYAYGGWIDRITGMQNPDIVVDMNQLPAGNNGSADTIEARLSGEFTEVLVNGAVVVRKSFARLGTLTLIGSNDQDLIKIDGRLGVPLKPIDGRGGNDQVEINDRPATNYLYQVASNRVGNENWSVGLNSIENLVLYTSDKATDVAITSLVSGRTTVYGGNQSERFTVAGQAGSLDDLARYDSTKTYGSLTVVGGGGVDALIIQEGAASALRTTPSSFTVTDTNVYRNRVQPNFDGWQSRSFGVSTDYSGFEVVKIVGSRVGNQFAVKSTPSATPVIIEGSDGADSFVIGNSQFALGGIRQLSLDGKAGNDSLTFIDTAKLPSTTFYQGAPTYALGASTLVRNQSVRSTLNSATVQIESQYSFLGMEDLTLWGSHLGSTYNVQGARASSHTKVRAGSGDDRIFLTSLDLIEEITIDGGAGNDHAAIDDRWNPAASAGPLHYALGATYLQVDVNGVAKSTVNFLLDVSPSNPGTPGHLERLDAFTSHGDDVVDIYATWAGLPVTLAMGEGNDVATVHHWGPWVLDASLRIDGESGEDQLIVEDRQSGQPQAYEINVGSLGRSGATMIEHDAMESVELWAGDQDDLFYVTGNGSLMTAIHAGEGNDSFFVEDASGTLDSIQGWLRLEGEGGYNTAFLSDALQSIGQRYGIDASSISRSGMGIVSHTDLQGIYLTLGTGDDVVSFGHTDGIVPLYLDGNAGRDRLDYSHHELGVYVDLSNWIATDTGWVMNFEDVTGGSGDDWIVGDDQDNVLEGGAGNDYLEGRLGVDAFFAELAEIADLTEEDLFYGV